MRPHDQSRLLMLLALSLATFLPWLGRRDIVTSHEARVVQTARQMADAGWPWNAVPATVPRSSIVQTPQGERLLPRADGAVMSVNPWIVPVMNGQIRLQKPPLPYWITAILYRWFGVSEFTSRIVPASLGAIGVLLVWDLARMLIGRVGALYAGLVWVSSYFIVDEFRKAMADPYLAFFTLCALWAWLRAGASCSGNPSPLPVLRERQGEGSFKLSAHLEAEKTLTSVLSRNTGRGSWGTGDCLWRGLKRWSRTIWMVLFYLALGLGILAKGPIIFLFVIPILLIHRFTRKPQRVSIVQKHNVWPHVLGVIVVLAITLPWLIGVLRSVPNVAELWRFESLGALSDKDENARPFWFYIPNLFLITLPWTPVWVMGLVIALRYFKRQRLFAIGAVVALVLFFSIPHPKKNAYLLPLMPLMAIIAADGLRWLSLLPRRRSVRVAIGRTAVAAVAFCIAIQIFLSGFYASKENRRSPRQAAEFAQRLVADSNGRLSLLASQLADEVTVYLPLHPTESRSAESFLDVADDRSGLADQNARSIVLTPAGPVSGIEPIEIPNAIGTRWKLYRMNTSPNTALP